MQISIPAVISKITTMADKTLRLQVDCQETTPDIKADIFSMHESYGYFLFADKKINKSEFADLPDIVVEKGEKTPSQRLRGVMFVLWQQKYKATVPSFDDFYRTEYNKIIEHYKTKLDN
jgi:hypothetical protein